jgi:hypothetical protein
MRFRRHVLGCLLAAAVVDVATDRTPRHAGPRIPLEQDGRVTAG